MTGEDDGWGEPAELAVAAAGDRLCALLGELDAIHRELAGLVRRRGREAWGAAQLDRYHELARAELVAHRRLVVARDRFDAARRRVAIARARSRAST